jgi:hypothetical protein
MRLALTLAPRIADAARQAEDLREDFLAARIERRQAETLVDEAEARDARAADRGAQQALDDWFGNRRHRAANEARPADRESTATAREKP